MVNGKEPLPGSKGGLWAEDYLSISMLLSWQDKIVRKYLPVRELEVVRLEAIASYERCRVADECRFNIAALVDLISVYKVISI